MDETCGPIMHDCPERIMKLLTPIAKPENKDSGKQWARNWRAKNWKEIRKRKRNRRKGGQFKVGDTVVFRRPMQFSNGTERKELKVKSTRPLRFTDGTCNDFGFEASYKIKRATIDCMLEKIIPASKPHEPEVIEYDTKDCPIYIDDFDHEHKILGWASGMPRSNWEWYATKCVDKKEQIYYGFVMGFEYEWGTFSVKELTELGIRFITNPEELNQIMPPPKWRKVS